MRSIVSIFCFLISLILVNENIYSHDNDINIRLTEKYLVRGRCRILQPGEKDASAVTFEGRRSYGRYDAFTCPENKFGITYDGYTHNYDVEKGCFKDLNLAIKTLNSKKFEICDKSPSTTNYIILFPYRVAKTGGSCSNGYGIGLKSENFSDSDFDEDSRQPFPEYISIGPRTFIEVQKTDDLCYSSILYAIDLMKSLESELQKVLKKSN